ncbi:hypothetical protein HAX54_020019, partial [Datura stramonium]|nr:hypothetical protein [Datura stramonium]
CSDSLVCTHRKVCIEEPSLEELNPKVIETTCPMEQAHVDEKDKGKENYFGDGQDKTHDKKSNKTIVNLTPMSKEKRGDVIPLLHKTKYSIYNWFIHILGIPTTPKVFPEVFATSDEEIHDYENFNAYVNNSYIKEFVSGVIEDAWLYHKSVQFDARFRDLVSPLPCPFEYSIDRIKLELHVSFPMTSRRDF